MTQQEKRATVTLTLQTQTDEDAQAGKDPMFELTAIWRDVPQEGVGMLERDIVDAVNKKSAEWDQANLERKLAGK